MISDREEQIRAYLKTTQDDPFYTGGDIAYLLAILDAERLLITQLKHQNETPMSEYDSRSDTVKHIMRVRELLYIVQNKLEARGFAHDQSKLGEPEKYTFDTCTAKLKAMAYGSDEYKAALVDLKPALDHHYAANSHHPEHFETGVSGMSLLDVIEMLIDWKAATERMKNGGDIRKSLELNTSRFNLSPQLVSILANTIQEMGW